MTWSTADHRQGYCSGFSLCFSQFSAAVTEYCRLRQLQTEADFVSSFRDWEVQSKVPTSGDDLCTSHPGTEGQVSTC